MNQQNIKLSWAHFESMHENVTDSFEDLCRLLFKKQFFDNNVNFVSKPNHPGVEIFPLLEKKSEKKISFQSKFFKGSVDYSQIRESINKAIKYYSNDLDIFYLYCNKDMDVDSKSYKGCEKLLNDAGIELQIITNKAILDLVIGNQKIAEYFFGQHTLNDEWFKECLEQSLDSMGTRYNKLFNVSTETERDFKLFLENEDTLEVITEKKTEVLKELLDLEYYLPIEVKSLVRDMVAFIQAFEIEKDSDIEESLHWNKIFQEKFSEELTTVNLEIEKLHKVVTNTEQEEQEKRTKIYRLNTLLGIPHLLEFSKQEQSLITKNALIIDGKAGNGKSQLLSETANRIVRSDGYAVLLPGHVFLTSLPIKEQILSYLGLKFDFNEFLNIIDTLGELAGRNVYIFIDAINESNNRDIWKTGLAQIFREINKLDCVKIAISFRSGYEQLILDESIKQKIKEYEIPRITHYGFQKDSVDAIREFLNYYKIPFFPSYFLQPEMTNPLFLTMFCKVYDGRDFNLYHVIKKFLEVADKEALKAADLPYDFEVLIHLISEVANLQLKNKNYSIRRKDLLLLEFWNEYGLSMKKVQYLSSLTKSGVFLTFVRDGEEMYRFGYNFLEDFIYAKVIIDKFSSAEECKKYLREELLEIEEGRLINRQYIDVFIVATSLFAEKFGEEAIDVVEKINNEYEKDIILDDFTKSFSWRPSNQINQEFFREFINENNIEPESVFSVLLENSIKPSNPLNADFLHDILINRPLNERDYIWTTYINGLADEEERIFQLISFLDKGKIIDKTREHTRLLLILFSWLLTSSNRLLRDKTSKAMIELLKSDFSFCAPLLKRFEAVNDPYIIQRLYGIIFGACTKNRNIDESSYKELAEYVYSAIFEKDLIYPDILLRDYAKLIIEYFLFKFPKSVTRIKGAKIKPPYKSLEIPISEKVKDNYEGGLNTIAYSMAPKGVDRMYGDFGRYVFDAALNHFDEIDNTNIYNYSMYFIENELGYKNELFAKYDSNRGYYDRHVTHKTERIGKKYQWITMYNILARVSDHHKLSDRWNEEGFTSFDGAWNPYVRDFDPTLNSNFLDDPNRPQSKLEKPVRADFISKDASEEEISAWVNEEVDNFFDVSANIVSFDEFNNVWIALEMYSSIKNSDGVIIPVHFDDRTGEQEKWQMALGYFVKKDEFEILQNDLRSKNFMGRWFPEGRQSIYWLFNREFGWSTGYKLSTENEWLDYKRETGEFETVKYPDYNDYFDDLDGIEKISNGESSIRYKEFNRPIKEVIAKVMPASSRFLWEEQYDASQNEATAFDIPCRFLIDDLELEQQEFDGYFYDKLGELVVYYSKDSMKYNSPNKLLIRKKHLDKFLKKNELVMFWTCLGEKRFMLQEMRNQKWSEWSGLLTLTDEGIIGEMSMHKDG